MDYYCEVCKMFIKPKSKSKHFKSNNHKNLDKQKPIKLTINNPDIDSIDKILYTHINEYDNNNENYFLRCEYKFSFFNLKDPGIALSIITAIKTTVSWKIFVENAINNYKSKGFDFSHISQVNIIIVCKKMVLTNDF